MSGGGEAKPVNPAKAVQEQGDWPYWHVQRRAARRVPPEIQNPTRDKPPAQGAKARRSPFSFISPLSHADRTTQSSHTTYAPPTRVPRIRATHAAARRSALCRRCRGLPGRAVRFAWGRCQSYCPPRRGSAEL